jgi:hypothetical protein
MPQETRLWEVKDKNLWEVPRDKIDLEERLVEWLKQDISTISDDLLAIDRQVKRAWEKLLQLRSSPP